MYLNKKIRLKGDAKMIVDALNLEGPYPTSYGSLVDDTRVLLKTFLAWGDSFVKRDCNVVAHTLARMAASNCLHKVRVESFPGSISGLVDLF